MKLLVPQPLEPGSVIQVRSQKRFVLAEVRYCSRMPISSQSGSRSQLFLISRRASPASDTSPERSRILNHVAPTGTDGPSSHCL